MKILFFGGELTDISAKKETLVRRSSEEDNFRPEVAPAQLGIKVSFKKNKKKNTVYLYHVKACAVSLFEPMYRFRFGNSEKYPFVL